MSEENIEVVRRAFEAWEAGNLSCLLALLDDDLVTRRVAPHAGPRHVARARGAARSGC